MDQYESNQINMENVWIKVDKKGSKWIDMDPKRSKWNIMDQDRLIWIKIG